MRRWKAMLSAFHYGLRFQLILSFLASTTIVLILTIYMIYVGIFDVMKNQSQVTAEKLFDMVVTSVQNYRMQVEKTSDQLIASPHMQAFIDGIVVTDYEKLQLSREMIDLSDQYIDSYDYIHSIFFLADDGRLAGVWEDKFIHSQIDFERPEKFSQFLGSAIREQAVQQFPSMVWDEFTAGDFESYPLWNDEAPQLHVISAVRRVRSLQYGKTGFMIININERMLSSSYYKVLDMIGSEMYIVDAAGKIISHPDELRIGLQSKEAVQFALEQPKGSFMSDQNIVFYNKLGDTGWTMVQKTPVNELIQALFEIRSYLLWIVVAAILVSVPFSYYWIRKITTPLIRLSHAMSHVERGQLDTYVESKSKNELARIIRSFNRMSQGISHLMRDNARIEAEKRRIEIEALQHQINPHFLFNTLNTIKWMAIIIKADHIAKSIATLGNLLGPIFKSPASFCTLREELEYIGHYIELMNMRYNEEVGMVYDIPDDAMDCIVLRFILQPIIENAFVHGLKQRRRQDRVSVSARRHNGMLTIEISDNGEGMTPARLKEVTESLELEKPATIGLFNVNRRLRLNFGEGHGIAVASAKGEGTTVTMRLPVPAEQAKIS